MKDSKVSVEKTIFSAQDRLEQNRVFILELTRVQDEIVDVASIVKNSASRKGIKQNKTKNLFT